MEMSKWVFLIKYLKRLLFKQKEKPLMEEETVDVYACVICDSWFMDKNSYLMHFKVGTCNLHPETLPEEPIEIRTNDE